MDSTERELENLKTEAQELGITYHPSIGIDKLKAKIREERQLLAELDNTPKVSDPEEENKEPEIIPIKETLGQKKLRLKRDATRLIRCRVTCMNPIKKDLHGEIFAVGNKLVKTIKVFVPYQAEEGWHIPNMILQVLQEKVCQIFVTATDSNGRKTKKAKLIKEYSIEMLPPLTTEELATLAATQAATKSLED